MAVKGLDVVDDKELEHTINSEKKDGSKKKKPNRPKKEEKVVSEPQEGKEGEKPVKIDDKDNLDPKEMFLEILADVGVKRGALTMTEMFFSGDITDPSWLDQTLVSGGINQQSRRLIITRYYGSSPEELGITLLSASKARQGAGAQQAIPIEEPGVPLDVQKEYAQMLKRKWDLIQQKQLVKEMKKLEQEDEPKAPQSPRKVVIRPMFNTDGTPKMENGQPVVERIVYEGGMDTGSSGSDNGMMPLMFGLMMKFMDDKGKTTPADPNTKPVWAVDLENRIAINKADEEKKRLEDELRREREKREEQEKAHRQEFEKEKERLEEQRRRDKEDQEKNLIDLKESFKAEMAHRDELNQIVGGISAKHEDEMKKMKAEIEATKKDIQQTVVSEASKSVSKTGEKVGELAETVVQPMIETMRDSWRTQIDLQRKSQGLPALTPPKTSDEELRKVINS